MPNYTANIEIKAQDKASASIDKLSKKFDPLNRKAKNFDKHMSKADKSIKKSSKSMSKMTKMIGLAAVAALAFKGIKMIGSKINDMDALAKSARTAGAMGSKAAFEGWQVLRNAMGEAGIEAGVFDLAMLQTTQRLQKGTEGQKSFAAITDKLGSSIKKSNGELKSGPELMKAMINGLNNGKISTEEFAKVVGGKAGPLIQARFASLNKTAGALEATLEDVRAHSDIVSPTAAKAAERFNDNIGRLKNSFSSLGTGGISKIMPLLAKLTDKLLKVLPPIIKKISSAFAAVGEVLGPLARVLLPLIWKALWPIRTAFKVLGWYIKTIIFPIFKVLIKIITKVADICTFFADKIIGAFESIGNVISAITGPIKGLWDLLPDWVTGNNSNDVNVTANRSITHEIVNAAKKVTAKPSRFKQTSMLNTSTSGTNLTVNVAKLTVDGADPVGNQKELEVLVAGISAKVMTGVIRQSQQSGGILSYG
jgi:hypothetical protein